MENAEEILQCLDEFAKLKPKDIPRELEDYLCFVAKTGDPVYQWPLIKCLFREKLISVITDFYESCPTVEIPPCPNVDTFDYDAMKNFILEKLDTFAAAPFTVQRICELLTSPRKEYNRIDKYMRALEKNILVVSTREPGNRKSAENGESVVNGLESEHVSQEIINSDINVEVEMDETSVWPKAESTVSYAVTETNIIMDTQPSHPPESVQDTYVSDSKSETATCSSSIESVITSRPIGYIGYTPNITDLIIEPSNISADSEAPPAPAAAESSESPPEGASINVFSAINPEPAEEAAQATKNIEQVEPVFVKADCSDSSYSQIEPEPSLVQIKPLVRKSETDSSDNDAERISPETSSGPVSGHSGIASTSVAGSTTGSSTSSSGSSGSAESAVTVGTVSGSVEASAAGSVESSLEEPQESVLQSESIQVEPESSSTQLEPESSSSSSSSSYTASESVASSQSAECQNETTISSSDEPVINSSDSPATSTTAVATSTMARTATAAASTDAVSVEALSTTTTTITTVETSPESSFSDDHVSESNVESSEYVESATSVEESTLACESSAEASTGEAEEATGEAEEVMQVDEITTEAAEDAPQIAASNN